ncbi:MAG TPA: hypothetical protein VK666_23885 [Chryseolinea sp.]|nr:hypothetical protein [Chryseolinea sp.]
MIATLSSFASQFEPALLEKAKSLIDNNAIQLLSNKELNWDAVVMDKKNYKVTVRVEKNKVTDVFCSCSPAVCPHITAVLYALQVKLDIKPEEFKPEFLAPEPAKVLGNKINNMIWTSRAENTKDGELEKLGAHLSLKDTNITKLRVIVRKDRTGRPMNPIFVGAHKLMGAAIREYGKANYEAVFDVARAVLEEIGELKAIANSAMETGEAAAALMEEIYNQPDISPELRNRIFTWVTNSWKDKTYQYFHEFLIRAVTSCATETPFSVKATKLLQQLPKSYNTDDAVAEALQRLLKRQGNNKASREFMYKDVPRFRIKLIEEAFDNKDFAEAKKLAYDGLASEETNKEDIWEWLHKVATADNDVPALRRYYQYSYLNSKFDETFYEKCRATYDEEEWTRAYPKWIEAIGEPGTDEKKLAIADIYMREEEADSLAMFLEKFPDYLLALETQVFLEKTHPLVVRKVFHNFFLAYTKQAQHNGEVGQRIRSLLGYACKTPWSKKMIKELRSKLLELHPTWKSFKAALSKPL